jgi:hypothetical protein
VRGKEREGSRREGRRSGEWQGRHGDGGKDK